jgi:hypothetical protein
MQKQFWAALSGVLSLAACAAEPANDASATAPVTDAELQPAAKGKTPVSPILGAEYCKDQALSSWLPPSQATVDSCKFCCGSFGLSDAWVDACFAECRTITPVW